MSTKTIFMFSGQGSQTLGMGRELCGTFPASRRVFELASEILGFDLAKIAWEGPESDLAKTVYSQPAIMACSLAALEAAKERGLEFQGVMGHSLGEYAAMAAAGMVTMEDGFRLIKARAAAMQNAAEKADGAMYAIIGLDAAEVERVCEETPGYVVPVNYNSTAQTVIAGETAACEAAAEKFTEMKKRAVKLGVSSAFHSRLMAPAAEEFLPAAREITFREPEKEFYSNVLGARLTDFSDMPALLAKHIVSPVRFTSELSETDKAGYTAYMELGPGKVLSGLVKKTLKGVTIANIDSPEALEKAAAALAEG